MTERPERVYCVDTSALIDGLERFYPPQHFPALWDAIDGLVQAGRFLLSEEVYVEATRLDKAAKEWCEPRQQQMVVATTAEIAMRVRRIVGEYRAWTTGFRNRADPFVIAVAEELQATVITGEKGGSPERPKIPYVCGRRNIQCESFLYIIREEGWSF